MLSSISPEAACTSARPPNCMRLTPLVGPWKRARGNRPVPQGLVLLPGGHPALAGSSEEQDRHPASRGKQPAWLHGCVFMAG